MEKPEDVWLEATVNSRLVDLAKALGWRTVARPYGLTFRGPPGDGVETAAVRAAGGEGVRLVLAVARGGESAALTRRELEFLMRRNDRLATCHWCLTRFGDVVVTAYVPLSGLTADSLGAAVRNLADERALLIALAPAECEDEPGAQPRPGDAEEAQAEKK